MLWKKIFPVCTCFCVVRPLDYAQKRLGIGDWLLISLQFYLTGVFPALINPCHLHTFYDRVSYASSTGVKSKINIGLFTSFVILKLLKELTSS